jgi:thioesterase domain-containing protein/acyl carrier protein
MTMAANGHDPATPAAGRLSRAHFFPLRAFVAPASETERRLKDIWEAVLDIDGLGVEDDFFEFGGESLAAVTLFAEMERALGEMPPLSTLLDYPTIRSLAARLENLGAVVGAGLVIAVRAQGMRLPLFNTHAAYGNVLFVRKLLPFFDPEQPLYAIQARGLREGETPHRRFEAMAADYVDQIRRIQPAGPYFLAGHCVGGLIAFEMAQRLKDLGQPTAMVIMIDPEYHPNAVPWLHWRDPDSPMVRAKLTLLRPLWFARRWLRRIGERLAGRPVVEQESETGANRRRQQALIAGLTAAFKAYRPRPYAGRVVVLCSAERRRHLSDPKTGWPAIAPRTEFIEISSSHDEAFFGALPAVGETLEKILGQAQPAKSRQATRSAAE